MSLQDLGAIGDLVGGIAVVVSLVYLANQIRHSSRQMDQNSRQLEASMYVQTNDAFSRWWTLLAASPELSDLWLRGLAGEELGRRDGLRFRFLMGILWTAFENNFQQVELGAVRRNPLTISGRSLRRLLTSPGGERWWATEAADVLTPEFRAAVEAALGATAKT
jgi:hypothetical protein